MTESTGVLVCGGGPAGMMLGLLLARAGLAVTVLEKHGDFLRDFRGDTVHPATVRLMDELGLGEEPGFSLRMNTAATEWVRDGEKVVGARYRTADGHTGEIRAELTVGCDGRHSTLRREAGLVPKEFRVPFDVWWFRLPRSAEESAAPAGVTPVAKGVEALISLARDDYYQVAYFTAKGSDARLRAEGIESFRERIAGLRPEFADRVAGLASMDEVFVLDVKLNRLKRWYLDGLLLIGDAAHAMSPAGGVGINLAIQDAVAAATILAEPLRRRAVTHADLAAVQRRRHRPTVVVQTGQRLLQRVMFEKQFAGKRSGPPKALLFLSRVFPRLRTLPARFVGFGPRPGHAPGFASRNP
ncbi:FAD-dependent oxidoreductase [Amycolatopsis lurida]